MEFTIVNSVCDTKTIRVEVRVEYMGLPKDGQFLPCARFVVVVFGLGNVVVPRILAEDISRLLSIPITTEGTADTTNYQLQSSWFPAHETLGRTSGLSDCLRIMCQQYDATSKSAREEIEAIKIRMESNFPTQGGYIFPNDEEKNPIPPKRVLCKKRIKKEDFDKKRIKKEDFGKPTHGW